MNSIDSAPADLGCRLAARRPDQPPTQVRVCDVAVGGPEFVVIAGPCAVESESQIRTAADAVIRAGARMLRGGAFKPRTSPYAFQGLGREGLALLASAAAGRVPIVTEVVSTEDIPLVAAVADVLQVGARNMHNYALLKALGGCGRAVLLKRGFAATLGELLSAAEYLLAHGCSDVILCERGIRTFETATRNTLDLSAVARLKQLTHLPVIVDPSHATGRADLVAPMATAALAVGADGILVEVHPDPTAAQSDKEQALTSDEFDAMMHALAARAPVFGRTIAGPGGSANAAALDLFRERLDHTDELLVALLCARMALATEIGRVKTALGQPIYAPDREAAVMARVGEAAGPARAAAVAHIYEAVINATRAMEASHADRC